jgi:hypothetical protein
MSQFHTKKQAGRISRRHISIAPDATNWTDRNWERTTGQCERIQRQFRRRDLSCSRRSATSMPTKIPFRNRRRAPWVAVIALVQSASISRRRRFAFITKCPKKHALGPPSIELTSSMRWLRCRSSSTTRPALRIGMRTFHLMAGCVRSGACDRRSEDALAARAWGARRRRLRTRAEH